MKANLAELMSHRQRTASKYYRVVNRNKTSTKQETGETPIQFLTRLDNYLLHWIELARAEKSFEGIKALVVQQQYLSTCPKEIAMHPKEGKPTTIRELGEKSLKTTSKRMPRTSCLGSSQGNTGSGVCSPICDAVTIAC